MDMIWQATLDGYVKLLYDNREMTRKLGLNARKRIIQEFSPNEYIEKLNSIYTKANLRE